LSRASEVVESDAASSLGLFDGQWRILAAPTPNCAVEGGRQIGKSHVIAALHVTRALGIRFIRTPHDERPDPIVFRHQGRIHSVKWKFSHELNDNSLIWWCQHDALAFDQFYLSVNEDKARDWFERVVKNLFLKLFEATYQDLGWGDADTRTDDFVSSVVLPNQRRIVVMASNWRTARSMAGDVTLDEFAFVAQPLRLAAGASGAVTTLGKLGRLTYASTHNGPETEFARIIDSKKHDPNWTIISWYARDAYRDGWRPLGLEDATERQVMAHLRSQSISEASYREDYEGARNKTDALVIDLTARDYMREHIERATRTVTLDPASEAIVPGPATWTSEGFGCWIWEEPQPDVRYVIGGDFASGAEQGNTTLDKTSLTVTRYDNASTVAHAWGRIGVTHAAMMMALLGKYYNGAVLAPERNSMGSAALTYLLGDGVRSTGRYPRELIVKTADQTLVRGRKFNRYGIWTAGEVRASMIEAVLLWANRVVPSGASKQPCARFALEADQLIQRNGKIFGDPHDDAIMSKAMSLYGMDFAARSQRGEFERGARGIEPQGEPKAWVILREAQKERRTGALFASGDNASSATRASVAMRNFSRRR